MTRLDEHEAKRRNVFKGRSAGTWNVPEERHVRGGQRVDEVGEAG
eukprot:CAMPEP_0172524318 /NCGR_PEP_ID=MMETSP1066-20121228/294123_1 /TAXON_ID=671091 /ORGANISM="Coscinodiscus wailesii, Strain CCMP2513" /LENGTH=44 /DNA_ID= /DNA_START= /DNA_END= /DNA_ORIENTATION=